MTAPFVARSLTPVPRSLLLNRTETLATQANNKHHLSPRRFCSPKSLKCTDREGLGRPRLIGKQERKSVVNCWFSHDVTKIQTKQLSILTRFYFHYALEQLKANFHTNFRFKRVPGFVIEYV